MECHLICLEFLNQNLFFAQCALSLTLGEEVNKRAMIQNIVHMPMYCQVRVSPGCAVDIR